jgi:hypothetical protein
LISEDELQALVDEHDEDFQALKGKLEGIRGDLKNSQDDNLVNLETQITDYQLITLMVAFKKAESA